MMRTLIFAVLFVIQCALHCCFAEEALRIGTTFSPRQSEYLDIDWKETYLSILGLGFDLIRLGAYWNEIEKEEGAYDFSALDWQVSEARGRGIPVILTVGMKAPRWPEYFIPCWVMRKASLPFGADVSRDEYLKERTLNFIEKVVNHYKDDPIIHYWQVENEPLNRMGEKRWFIGKAFLRQEVALVRKLDKRRRPILLTVATYPNRILRFIAALSLRHDPIKECLKMCDILGLNVYPVVGHKFWRLNLYFWTGREERERYFSKLLKLIRSNEKKAWIVELQAEPWEPGRLVYKEKKRPPTEDPRITEQILQDFHRLGVNTILLWGAEYWYFREKIYGDTKWQDAVSALLSLKTQQ